MSIPETVLKAFAIKGGPLPDRENGGFRFGEIVLVPDQDTVEGEWKGQFMKGLACKNPDPEHFRVAVPLQTVEGCFVFEGWMAFHHGPDVRSSTEHWVNILALTVALSAALKDTPEPQFLLERTCSSPRAVADRVAWEEADEIDIDPSLASIYTRLKELQKPVKLACQLIHGNMTGNVVLSNSGSPIIFDFFPIWRPAYYSRAIVIVDALIAHRKTQDVIAESGVYELTVPQMRTALQLLLRALLSRLVQRSILVTSDGPISNFENDALESASREVRWLMAVVYSDLGRESSAKYVQSGDISFLNSAIEHSEQARKCADRAHPDWAIFHHNLSELLRMHSGEEKDVSGRRRDLDQAVDCAEVAVEHGGDKVDEFLHHQSNALLARYESFGDERDLKRSLESIKAIKLDDNRAEMAPCYSTLACIHKEMFERDGQVQDIDAAIVAADKSINAVKSGHADMSHVDAGRVDPHYATYQNQLGNALSRRFERTGALADADASIVALQVATCFEHKNQGAFFTNLGDALRDRFERTGQTKDIEEAVEACRRALGRASEPKHPRRGLYLHNLGCVLQRQFETATGMTESQREQIIDEAINCKEEASSFFDKNARVVCSLASALRARSALPLYGQDLDRAIDLLQSLDHIDHAGDFIVLGHALNERYERDGLRPDLTGAIDAYQRAHGMEAAPPLHRLIAAHSCSILLYLVKRDVAEAGKILRSAVHLMPRCSPQSINRTDQQFFLAALYGLSSSAAAVCLESGGDNSAFEALDLLETGRGIISTLQLRTRADLTALESAHPDKAKHFIELRDEIQGSRFIGDRLPSSTQGSNEECLRSHQARRRHATTEEFEDLITEIRGLDDFHTFLSGPCQSDLFTISEAGPVVVLNCADIRCDAIIIEKGEVTAVPLTTLSAKAAKEMAESFAKSIREDDAGNHLKTIETMNKTLEWLWESAIKHVLEALGLHIPHKPENGPWPHIWWIPTGVLSSFPIHGAGYHGKRASKGNVLDCVVSSYAPSVKALLNAINKIKGKGGNTEAEEETSSLQKRVALVAAPETPNWPPLKFANDELKIVKDSVTQYLHTTVETLEEKPLKVKVMELLKWCHIIHLATHGDSLPDPSTSHIVVYDWQDNSLCVRDISEMHLPHAELMYLSACHTMHMKKFTLQDESIHLVGACLLAGFPRVVGTLWQVVDARSTDLAKEFYSNLLVDYQRGRGGKLLQMENVGLALHKSVRILRDATMRVKGINRVFPPDPVIWTAYVHVGA